MQKTDIVLYPTYWIIDKINIKLQKGDTFQVIVLLSLLHINQNISYILVVRKV